MGDQFQKCCIACHQQILLIEDSTCDPSRNIDICSNCINAISCSDFLTDDNSIGKSMQVSSKDETCIDVNYESHSPSLPLDGCQKIDAKQIMNHDPNENVDEKEDVELLEIITPGTKIKKVFQQAHDNGEVIPVFSSPESNGTVITLLSSPESNTSKTPYESPSSVVFVGEEIPSHITDAILDPTLMNKSTDQHEISQNSTLTNIDTRGNEKIESDCAENEEFQQYDSVFSHLASNYEEIVESAATIITRKSSDNDLLKTTDETQYSYTTPSINVLNVTPSSNSPASSSIQTDNKRKYNNETKVCLDCNKQLPYKCESYITRCTFCYISYKRKEEKQQQKESPDAIQKSTKKVWEKQCIVCKKDFTMTSDEYNIRLKKKKLISSSFSDYCKFHYDEQVFIEETQKKQPIYFHSLSSPIMKQNNKKPYTPSSSSKNNSSSRHNYEATKKKKQWNKNRKFMM